MSANDGDGETAKSTVIKVSPFLRGSTTSRPAVSEYAKKEMVILQPHTLVHPSHRSLTIARKRTSPKDKLGSHLSQAPVLCH